MCLSVSQFLPNGMQHNYSQFVNCKAFGLHILPLGFLEKKMFPTVPPEKLYNTCQRSLNTRPGNCRVIVMVRWLGCESNDNVLYTKSTMSKRHPKIAKGCTKFLRCQVVLTKKIQVLSEIEFLRVVAICV